MVASWMEWKRQRLCSALVLGIRRRLLLLFFVCMAGSSATTAYAQCGVGGIFSGECVDLFLNVKTLDGFVGGIIEVELHARSTNTFEQPIHSMRALVEWDPAVLELLGNVAPCTAGSSATPCFACPADVAAGIPSSHNWVTSGFPSDAPLDRRNADCGPDTFCPIYTGLPFNDGNLSYTAISQFMCNSLQATPALATPAPSSLLVTTFQFRALAGGTTSISLRPEAACSTRELVCIRGETDQTCSVDDDCGGRVCLGQGGGPCATDADCPGSACPPQCSACLSFFCCTADEHCTSCSYTDTRVLANSGFDTVSTGTLGPAVQATISDCFSPSLLIDSSRYLNIVPPAGTDPVAILVEGVSPAVSCVSKYVGSNGLLGDTPVYRTPAQWQSGMFDAHNDPNDPTVHARGVELVAGESYAVRMDCSSANPGANLSDPVEGSLWVFGDVDGNGDRSISDVLRILDGFSGIFFRITCANDAGCSLVPPYFDCDPDRATCKWTTREAVDIIGVTSCASDRDIGIRDALSSLEGFAGVPNSCIIACP